MMRIKKLREKMELLELDAFFISNFYNILYFLDFQTLTTDEREAFAMVTKKNVYLFTDARYHGEKEYILKLFEPTKGLSFHLTEIIRDEKIKKMGFESEDLRYLEYSLLQQKLIEVSFTPTDRIGVLIREIKEKEEINAISKACSYTGNCLEALYPFIREGISEKELAFKLETYIREHGYNLAFDPIVAFDANSAVPHYNTKTGNGRINKGSVILLDFGVKTENYLSDITRMVFFGKPSDDIMNTYMNLKKTQEETVLKVKDSEHLKDIDVFCRDRLQDLGMPEFPHSTGHGVGLEIHEYPKVSMYSTDLKRDNQIITIEPGVYYPGKYGMRVEDTVVIEGGEGRILTSSKKDPVLLG